MWRMVWQALCARPYPWSMGGASRCAHARRSSPTSGTTSQGLTLVHFSAQRKHICVTRWVPSVDRWVMTRHKLDAKRLTDQNGISWLS
jgi:hypothetical protein